MTAKVPYEDLTQLDDRLHNLKLKRWSTNDDRDGNCFFHAIEHQLASRFGRKKSCIILRKNCMDFLRENEFIGTGNQESWKNFVHDETAEAYLERMSQDGQWADHIVVQAMANVLNCVIKIITTSGDEKNSVLSMYPKTFAPHDEYIVLGHVAEYHYFSTKELEGFGGIKSQGREIQSLEEVKFLGADKPHLPPKSALKKPGSNRRRKESEQSVHATFQDEYENYQSHRDSFPLIGERMDEDPAKEYLDDEENEPLMRSALENRNRNRNVDNLFERAFFAEPPKPEIDPLDGEFKEEPPLEPSNVEGRAWHFFTKLAKFFSVIIFCVGVLFGSVASKGSLLVLANAYTQSYGTDAGCPVHENQHYYIRYTVMLTMMMCLCFPEVLSFAYCFYRIVMRGEEKMNWTACLSGLFPEILNAVGLTLLVLKVLPDIDATLAVLMFPLVGVIPSILHVHAKHRAKGKELALSIASAVLQLVGLVSLGGAIYAFSNEKPKWTLYCAVPFLVFISCRYWENFATCDFVFTENFKIKIKTAQKKLDIETRFKTGIIYSLVRMIFIVGVCFLIYFFVDDGKAVVNGKGDHFREYRPNNNCKRLVASFWNAALTHCACGLGAFWLGRTACQTMTQIQAYSFPLMLGSPTMSTLTAVYTIYGKNGKTPESLTKFFGLPVQEKIQPYINWRTYSFESWQIALVVVIGLVIGWASLITLTLYMWKSQQTRLAMTEVLFVKPIYGGILINEDLMLNRRQYQTEYREERYKYEEEKGKDDERKRRPSHLTSLQSSKSRPQVFLCATMWHETEQEMTQLLTSIMRLDRDQGEQGQKVETNKKGSAENNTRKSRTSSATVDPGGLGKDPGQQRRSAEKHERQTKKNKEYAFEVHIMFDNAMKQTDEGRTLNEYVHRLLSVIPIAANKVTKGSGENIDEPVIYPTPYGGRLDYVLPYKHSLYIHLKDERLIRRKKRWSQCMYMYYILSHLKRQKRKIWRKDDIFILALDGDVDFQPKALSLLLDRMKRNPDVGAACGRIHPTGSGPVVWFQKFEYAVGHWLQKSAEHVLGCVLCSPGCFSLFRGEALMDTNVLKTYTRNSTEAVHYIQWDQGEDRWLCTLMLKQGWRIEYTALSDSYTFAPEEFKEFYQQRRRWGPSTMANVLDILLNAGQTVKKNPYISWGYISYQMGLMISSILGPATVVLIVQGAFQYVFQMSAFGSLMVALIPVIIFVILCYTTEPKFQIAVAGILTVVYALVMMAVLVGIIGQMADTLLNPNSIFMLTMVSIYAITGIIHPTEMLCLLHGLLYYLCVPSAFILLMVYSLCNMNDVSWGTREGSKSDDAAPDSTQQAVQEVAKGKQGKEQSSPQLGDLSTRQPQKDSPGFYSCGLGNLCQCILCIQPSSRPSPKAANQGYQPLPTEDPHHSSGSPARRLAVVRNKEEKVRKYSIAKTKFMGEIDGDAKKLDERIDRRVSVFQLEGLINQRGDIKNVAQMRKKVSKMMAQHRPWMKKDKNDDEDQIDDERRKAEEREEVDWIFDGPWLKTEKINYIENDEHKFWRGMIKNYLHPFKETEEKKENIKKQLRRLRNKMTGGYFLINSLWIVLTFSLTLAIDDINITFTDKHGNEVVLQPLSFLFLIFFLVILVIQFVTMFIHRWSTFVHLMATTKFRDEDNQTKKDKEKEKKETRQRASTADPEIGASHVNLAYEDEEGNNNFSFGGSSVRMDSLHSSFPSADMARTLASVDETDAGEGETDNEEFDNPSKTTDETVDVIFRRRPTPMMSQPKSLNGGTAYDMDKRSDLVEESDENEETEEQTSF